MQLKQIPQILIAFCLMATPVAIGGVHDVVAATLVALGLLAWALQLLSLSSGDQPPGKATPGIVFSIPSMGLWLFAAVCIVQAIALPSIFHHLLNPLGQAHFLSSWQAAFGSVEPEGWRALSIDPGRTAEYGLRWIALAIFALVAANIGFRSALWRRLLWVVVAAGILVWTIGLIQQALDMTAFLGFYEATIGIRSQSTFVNKNHAAVFFGLVSLSAFAITMQDYKARPLQAIAASAFGVLFLVVMAMQKSDGTFLAYGLGLFFIAGALSMRMGLTQRALSRLKELQPTQWAVLATALGLGILVFLSLLGLDAIRQWFWESSFGEWLFDKGRVRVLMGEAALLGGLDFWRLGAGAGAMDVGLPAYVDWSEMRAATIPTVENEPLDWFFSFGLLTTLIGCLCFASGLYFSGRHLSNYTSRARYIVVFSLSLFIFVIAFFHFPFIPLGIALAFVVLFEVGMAPRRRRRRREEPEQAPPFASHISISVSRAWGLWVLTALAGALLSYLHFNAYAIDHDAVFFEGGGYDRAGAARLIELRPTDHEVLTRLAMSARIEGDYERSALLAERAFEVRPTNRQLLFLARSRALAKDRPGAVQAYQQLFGAGFATQQMAWVDRFMIRDLRHPYERAAALEEASPLWWRPAAQAVLKRDGLAPAVDFALELIERRPARAESYLALLDVYSRTGHFELAELWARQLIGRDLLATDEQWPAGYTELVELLIKMERPEEAWHIVKLTAEAGFADPRFAAQVLNLTPPVNELDETRRLLVAYAHGIYCPSPLEANRRHLCWQVEATLYERGGELERARSVYRRITYQLGNPRLLAHFLVRTHECQELERLILDLRRGRHPQAARHLRAVEAIARTCRRH